MSDQSADNSDIRSRHREGLGIVNHQSQKRSMNGANIISGGAQFRTSSGGGGGGGGHTASEREHPQTIAEPVSSGQSDETESSSQSSCDEPRTSKKLTIVKSADTSENNSTDDSDSKNQDSSREKSSSKTDRSKFRKGKWTVEEEEYTSRIIHYFRIGLLTLPDGATLRSYLADKLNCDPMRITKKYAGASCLGRRVYHHRDRLSHQPPTVTEIHLARVELDLLEGRFRSRAEGGDRNSPTGGTSSTSALLPMPTMPSAVTPNAGLAQAMALFLQNQQQQQQQQQQAQLPMPSPFLPTPVPNQVSAMNQQQTAATAATMMAAQQATTQIPQAATNPLQALLLSLAMAAGTGQPPHTFQQSVAQPPVVVPQVSMGNGSGAGVLNSPFSTLQQGQLQQPQALAGWLSQLSQMPSSASNAVATNMSGAPAQIPAVSQPITPQGTAIAPHQNNFFNLNSGAQVAPSASSTTPTSQILSQAITSQRTGAEQAIDANATLAALTKILGPTIAQSVLVAANLQKVEQQQQLRLLQQQPKQSIPMLAHMPMQHQLQLNQQQALDESRRSAPAGHKMEELCPPHGVEQRTSPIALSTQQAQSSQALAPKPAYIQPTQLQNQNLPANTQNTSLQQDQFASLLTQLQSYQTQLQKLQPQPQPIMQQIQAPPLQLPQQASPPQQLSQTTTSAVTTEEQARDFATKLKEVYEQHLKQQNPPGTDVIEVSPPAVNPIIGKIPIEASKTAITSGSFSSNQSKNETQNQIVAPNPTTSTITLTHEPTVRSVAPVVAPYVRAESTGVSNGQPNASEVVTGGNVLVGFLSSLRQSYEDALRDRSSEDVPVANSEAKDKSNLATLATHASDLGTAAPPSTSALTSFASIVAMASQAMQLKEQTTRSVAVTDSSSSLNNQTESSAEDGSDWNSDKKSDPSCGGDSDKELKASVEIEQYRNGGKGPPRKRLKSTNST